MKIQFKYIQNNTVKLNRQVPQLKRRRKFPMDIWRKLLRFRDKGQ